MDVQAEAQTKPLSAVSVFSYIPPRRKQPQEASYFNNDPEVPDVCMYDRLFHWAEGYDNRLHRDDRNHSKGRGLDIYKEEKLRDVPVRSSSEYGRRPPPAAYQPGRHFVRVAHIKAEFFQKNGIIWNVAEGYGPVVPV
ncbi:cilia- and flagella-associated protein 90 [Diretmus argenteus]